MMAVAAGVLIAIGDNAWERLRLSLTSDSPGLPFTWRLVVGFVALFVIVVMGKGLGRRGTVLRGGLVSGHAAYGFFIAGSIFWISDSPLVAGLGFLLAAIIAQSRWEAKIHSIYEVSLGGLVGLAMSLLIFGLMPK